MTTLESFYAIQENDEMESEIKQGQFVQGCVVPCQNAMNQIFPGRNTKTGISRGPLQNPTLDPLLVLFPTETVPGFVGKRNEAKWVGSVGIDGEEGLYVNISKVCEIKICWEI